jgi:hypothetical protein
MQAMTLGYDITYVPKEGFMVHLPDRDITFQWRGKLYVADFAQQGAVYATRAFTKAEIEWARTAYELIRAAGYPSYQEVIHLVQDGNITHLLSLTAEDIRRAQELFGYPPGYVRGKLTKQTTGRAIVDSDLIMDRKEQVLHTDVMHIDGHKFLITVCEPLCLTL